MTEFLKNKYVVGGIVILVVIGAWMTLGSPSSSNTAVVQGSGDGGPSANVDDLIQALTTLQTISLDGSIFTNPEFTSLKDFSRQIVNEPAGRHDPFAPVDSTNQQTALQTVATSPQQPTTQVSLHATTTTPVATTTRPRSRTPVKR